MKRILTFVGRDFWSYPVYKDQKGKLWKDISCNEGIQGALYSVTGNEFDGEPLCPMSKEVRCEFHPKRIIDTKASEDKAFRYMLLDRMRFDCEAHLGCSNRRIEDVQAHIAYMKELWNSFPEGEKPEWLTFEEIEAYEKAMQGF